MASGVVVTIMDSSTEPMDREPLKQKMKLADCIICLYDVSRLETLDSLHEGRLITFLLWRRFYGFVNYMILTVSLH